MKFLRRLSFWLRRDQLRDELEAHRTLAEHELQRDGLNAEEAHFAARRQMGNSTLALEASRGVWLAPWIESVFQDLRYAARSLWRQPSFTLPALFTLALGIGLNTSLFTVFNTIALRPIPVHKPSEVVNLNKAIPGRRTGFGGFGVSEYRFLRDHSKTMSGLVMERDEAVWLDGQQGGRRLSAFFVSGNFFRVLGVDMAAGRGFLDSEDDPGSPTAVAILSYFTWQNRYAGDPHIIGRQIRVDDTQFTVVGVTAEHFTSSRPAPQDLFTPLSSLLLVRPTADSKKLLSDPTYCCSSMLGRLAPGVSRKQAEAELGSLATQFIEPYERGAAGSAGSKEKRVVASGTAFLDSPGRKRQGTQAFVLMFIAVGLVLLLACANVSNLLLARSLARHREIAARLAIGASRARLIRQLLTESAVLALVACGLGLLLAEVLPGVVINIMAGDVPWLRIVPDATVLGYSIALALVASLVFGLAPALGCTRLSVSEALKQHIGGNGSRFAMREILVGAQVAISVILLAASGLMLRGVRQASSTDVGYRTQGVEIVTVELPAGTYDSARGKVAMARIVERLRPLADGEKLALTEFVPLGNSRAVTTTRRPDQNPDAAQPVLVQFVSPGYFGVFDIPLVAGRDFVLEDVTRKPVIVNEALAAKYWPGESAIGKSIINEPDVREVVGVVRDAQLLGLGPVEPMWFSPYLGGQRSNIVMRSRPGARDVIAAATQVEPRAIVTTSNMADQLGKWLLPAKTASAIAGALGILALVLATLGVFGVLAYSVEQRRREIGVRMALGARPEQVVGLVVRVNSRAIVLGLVAGLLASLAASELVSGFLYGVSRVDPLAYAGVLAILLVAAFIASAVPARRATKVDPLVALRYD
ncbi:MAG TPA: ABC transporter permease [Bryobacteraceae bacterium]|nr:ABC transporter permease [Bryobacteraceae bacterium]